MTRKIFHPQGFHHFVNNHIIFLLLFVLLSLEFLHMSMKNGSETCSQAYLKCATYS
jgi:hypothetical protein